MRLILLLPVAFALAASLGAAEPADLGISFTAPPGFSPREREHPGASWPEIYLVESAPDPGSTDSDAAAASAPRNLALWAVDKESTRLLSTIPGPYFSSAADLKKIFRWTIGPHSVLILPRVPGPAGGKFALFYLVFRGDGSAIALMAPRYRTRTGAADEEGPPSRMEKVIEDIIKSLKFTPDWKSADTPPE
jgi:hypothetical protein